MTIVSQSDVIPHLSKVHAGQVLDKKAIVAFVNSVLRNYANNNSAKTSRSAAKAKAKNAKVAGGGVVLPSAYFSGVSDSANYLPSAMVSTTPPPSTSLMRQALQPSQVFWR
jgi:hypothetical protein